MNMASKPSIQEKSLDNLESSEEEIDVERESIDEGPSILRPYDPKLIRVDPKVFSLRNIMDMIDDGDLELAPDFQRMKVWTPKQKSRLIESVLLRIPLPAFYFSSDKSGNMQVVDGLQRLSTIYDFVRRKTFNLAHLEYLDRELGGSSFADIEGTPWAKRIFTTQITANVIDPQTPSRVKFDVFKRINTGGTPLNSQEIRHCMSGTRSRNLLKSLTSLNSFVLATGGKLAGDIRMSDRELVLRWTAFFLLDNISAYGSETSATMEEFLNETAERIDNDRSLDLECIIEAFDRSMTMATEIFGHHAFRKWFRNDIRRYPLNKALFEAWGVVLAQTHCFDSKKSAKAVSSQFRNLCSDSQYFIDSISAGTGDPNKVRFRFDKVKAIIEEARE